MKIPGLADEADGGRLGGEHRLEAWIVRERAAGPLGHAEGGQRGEAEPLWRGEQLGVGGIGAGISRLDIVDAEHVELLRDQRLVLEREVDALGLGAVSQRRVVEIEAFAGHDLLYTTPNKNCRTSSTASSTASTITAILMAR